MTDQSYNMDAAFKHPVRITSSLERQHWLEFAVEALRLRFDEVGYSVPEKVRVSIGFPKRAASCGAIGECWSTKASSDAHAEIFVFPELTDGARILDVLAHEMVHATTPGAGHGKPFKQCALKIGLQGPMRATTAAPEFIAWGEALFKRIGPYPAGSLTDMPKHGTRMHKCVCSTCGYIARVSRKWLEPAGPPICPRDKVLMTNDWRRRRPNETKADPTKTDQGLAQAAEYDLRQPPLALVQSVQDRRRRHPRGSNRALPDRDTPDARLRAATRQKCGLLLRARSAVPRRSAARES
jgi:hypothetical protein